MKNSLLCVVGATVTDIGAKWVKAHCSLLEGSLLGASSASLSPLHVPARVICYISLHRLR
jgi:hypothetical protein